MGTLRGHGIAVQLPTGFDGRIFRRTPSGAERTMPVAHFATVPLPAGIADFGSGIVTELGPNDVFVTLFEYGPESLGKALFARSGMPRALGTGAFRPYTIRRGLGGQSGTQWFFTESNRPFTLYAVLGSHGRRGTLVPRINGLLQNIRIDATVRAGGAP